MKGSAVIIPKSYAEAEARSQAKFNGIMPAHVTCIQKSYVGTKAIHWQAAGRVRMLACTVDQQEGTT
jgi:hypothetical protein